MKNSPHTDPKDKWNSIQKTARRRFLRDNDLWGIAPSNPDVLKMKYDEVLELDENEFDGFKGKFITALQGVGLRSRREYITTRRMSKIING